MCGILLTDKLKSLNSIEHRGTESRCINVGSKYLIHHRLPIQTLDDDEWSQPVQLDRHRYLLFNGEIFNYNTSKYGSDTEYLKDFFTEQEEPKSKRIQYFEIEVLLDGLTVMVPVENVDEVISPVISKNAVSRKVFPIFKEKPEDI